MSNDTAPAAAPIKRKPSVGLIIGIILLPIVFAWFTLKKGYSVLTRVLSLGWMALGLVIGIASIGSTPPATTSTANDSAKAPAAQAVLKAGDTIRDGDLAYVVTMVEARDSVGDSFLRENASAGGILVVVSYTTSNVGEKPAPAYKLSKPKLVDPNGTTYDEDLSKTATHAMSVNNNAKVLSDLNPGITTTDAVVFEVAKDRWDPNTWKVKIAGKLVNPLP